jgi:cell division protein FtsW (lipid II flippase)
LILASVLLGVVAVVGVLVLWLAPHWRLYGVLAMLLVGLGVGLFTLLGGFSAQSAVSLLDIAKLGAGPAAFVVIAPVLTLSRKLQLRANERREAESEDEDLKRFRS